MAGNNMELTHAHTSEVWKPESWRGPEGAHKGMDAFRRKNLLEGWERVN